MRVVVIGGTGRIGKRVARLLVERGHDVLAVNRRPERAAVVLPDVVTAVADTNDQATLPPVLAGADAVVLATMPTREEPAAYLIQTRHVLDSVGPVRLVAVSSYLALDAPDGRPMLEAEPPHPYFRPIEKVYAAQAELFRARDDLDWLLVAPPPELYPYGDATGDVRVQEGVLLDHPARAELSMERLAAFVVDEVESPRHHRVLLSVAT
jgi:uncharacterized protein